MLQGEVGGFFFFLVYTLGLGTGSSKLIGKAQQCYSSNDGHNEQTGYGSKAQVTMNDYTCFPSSNNSYLIKENSALSQTLKL